MLDEGQPLQRSAAYDPFASDNIDIRKQLKEIHNQNFKQLREIYDLARSDAKQWSFFSLTIAILGFLGIAAGVVMAFTGFLSLGVLSSVASIIAETTAFLFFRQSNGSWKRLDDIYKEAGKRLDDTSRTLQDELQKLGEMLREKDRLERASKFVSEISDKETQDRLKEVIFWQMIGVPAKIPETPLSHQIQQLKEEIEKSPSSD